MRTILLAGALVLACALPVFSMETNSTLPTAVEVDFGPDGAITLPRYDHAAIAIDIDGRLDEPVWSELPAASGFRVLQPDTLGAPPYRTAVRFFYTEQGLYLGFDLEQPPETIVRRYVPRDNLDIKRDNMSFTLDTSGRGLYGYWMNVSLGDSQRDGTILPERQYSTEWDGAWRGASAETTDGWGAEIFIPWSQVAMPKESGLRRMAFYAQREVAHRNEIWGFPALPESQSRFMSAFQPLILEGIDPRQQWSVFPFASSSYDRVGDDLHYQAGFDLFWRPTSNFQLTATANPDFGSVESDDAVLNLTASETFFPEKRLFFQEGQEVFQATPRAETDGDQRFSVVNTRRIGGRPDDPALPPGVALPAREALAVADLLGAAKATGQFGAFRYGVLTAFEDETAFRIDDAKYLVEGRDFGAVRLLYEDSRGAAYRGIGFLSTAVLRADTEAFVHSADLHYLSAGGRWKFDGQLVHSAVDGTGSGNGATADFTFTPRQGLKHQVQMAWFDDRVDVNDLGFQIRNDNRDVWYRMEWVKSGLRRVRDFKLTPFLRYEENGDGYRTNNAVASGYRVTLNNLHSISGSAAWFPTRFDDRNSFGNGTFRVAERVNFELDYATDTARPLSFTGGAAYRGEFTGGRTLEGAVGVNWRPRSNINVSLEATYQDRDEWLLHQEGRNFTTFIAEQWQPELSFEVFPTAMQQFRVSLQWIGVRAEEHGFFVLPEDDPTLVPVDKPPGPTDDFSISQLNFQVRYRWQIAPLSDLFVVYTKGDSRRRGLQGFDSLFSDSWSEPLGDVLVIKLRYRLGS